MVYSTYILKCSDGSYYTGIAKDLFARLAAHNAGKASKCTRARLPVKLVWSREVSSKSAALKLEYSIKKLSHTAKVELMS